MIYTNAADTACMSSCIRCDPIGLLYSVRVCVVVTVAVSEDQRYKCSRHRLIITSSDRRGACCTHSLTRLLYWLNNFDSKADHRQPDKLPEAMIKTRRGWWTSEADTDTAARLGPIHKNCDAQLPTSRNSRHCLALMSASHFLRFKHPTYGYHLAETFRLTPTGITMLP